MAPLLKELSSIEVESLEIVVHVPESEQDSDLDTLTVTSNDLEVASLLMDTIPVNKLGPCCCGCCCPCVCA